MDADTQQLDAMTADEWDRIWDPPGQDPGGESRFHFIPGDEFILDIAEGVPAVWGEGESVGWSEGESLFVVGLPGVGKSTLAQQLLLGRLGLRDTVLGLPVATGFYNVLYLAADRPRQIARSLRRMVSEVDRKRLADRLRVWPGPLPLDLATHPDLLLSLCREAGADTVFIDSLKDLAMDLSKDDVGARINRAIGICLAEGVEVLGSHHLRKPTQQATSKTKSLSDVYGSTWIAAGAGSVVLLSGEPGAAYVDLDHLKQPAGDIGPMKVVHHHKTGTTALHQGQDLYAFLQAGTNGVTVREAARFVFGREPNREDIQKARRKLDDLVMTGKARKVEGKKGGRGGGEPDRYLPVRPGEAVKEPEMFA